MNRTFRSVIKYALTWKQAFSSHPRRYRQLRAVRACADKQGQAPVPVWCHAML